MSSSFIEYRGHGFWSDDRFIEHLVGEVADVLLSDRRKEEWRMALGAHWNLQATVHFTGWMHLKLDEYLSDEEKRAELCGIVQAVADRHAAEGPIHQTGVLLVRLLDGDISWDASSPLDYMVDRDKRV
jgi:hypothetical protein